VLGDRHWDMEENHEPMGVEQEVLTPTAEPLRTSLEG